MFSKSIEIIKINMKAVLAYATTAWGAFFMTLLQIFVFYYIWMAIYKDDSIINGISKEQIVTYIILSRIIYTQLTWGFIPKIGRKIQKGEIIMDLLKPIDFQFFMYVGRIGDFITFASMTAIPVLIVCACTLGIQIPQNPLIFIYFFISLFLAMTISFFVEFWIGLLSFYTNYTWGLQSFQESLVALFSGALIPLTFFPHWLLTIANLLPFKEMSYSPVAIYLGIITGPQIIETIIFQLLWAVALLFLSRLFYTFAIKKITVQGG
ncbi:MAG: ABC-2 family transporter protein [Candidatus Gastranaerophilaceae bacterium]